MIIPNEYFKPFPSYEDVFLDEIEMHKKHFLPICSINMKFIDPSLDEWVHIVSVKEIGEGCVGAATTSFHTEYTKEDMIGFDVIDGKYKFDSDWYYFLLEQKQEIIDLKKQGKAQEVGEGTLDFIEELEDYYIENEDFYNENKDKYLASGKFLKHSANSFLYDVAYKSDSEQEFLKDKNLTPEQATQQLVKDTNLMEVPTDNHGKVFPYIASLKGYVFQETGADNVYLFYNRELKKAVICFEYT